MHIKNNRSKVHIIEVAEDEIHYNGLELYLKV